MQFYPICTKMKTETNWEGWENMSKISGIGFHHAGLASADLERSLKFYIDGLGGKLMRSWGEGKDRIVMVDMGWRRGAGDIRQGGDSRSKTPSLDYFAFQVDSPDEAYEAALKAGASSHMEPQDMVLPSEPPCPIRVAFAKGPDGEILEFIHQK